MNEPENTVQDASETAELRQQLADLRRQSLTLYLALTVLSLTLAAFIGVQARRAGKDLEILRPQANQLLDVNKKSAPVIQNFIAQLEAYAKGHPDYANTVLAKYGIRSNAAPASATAPAAPKK